MITANFGITVDKIFIITNCPHLALTKSPTLVISISRLLVIATPAVFKGI